MFEKKTIMGNVLNSFKKFVGLCKTRIISTISPKTNCSQKHSNGDYYCDSEMPFIAFKE